MNDLVLCSSCSRHVRRAEDRCPFCATPLSPEARRAKPPIAPAGLSRAKLYAFHAAVATGLATAACGGETITGGVEPPDATANDAPLADDAPSADDVQTAIGAAEAGAQDTGTESSTAEAGADAAADAGPGTIDATPDRYWGPPPPPYGCVFPEGCGDVKV
jgi:hypothetical protein